MKPHRQLDLSTGENIVAFAAMQAWSSASYAAV